MPRIARKDNETRFYHVMVQGLAKEIIFEKKEFKSVYLKRIKRYKTDDVKIYAYCVMPNHAHLLVYAENVNNLSLLMKKINLSYAVYYNKVLERVGYVFRDRYKTQGIYSSEHLISCLNYIHNNPVKAGLAKKARDYPYSSYLEYLLFGLKKSGSIIDIKEFLEITKLSIKEILDLNQKEYTEEWMDEKPSKSFTQLVDEFIKDNNLNDIGEVKTNRKLFMYLIDKINKESSLSLRKIAENLGISRKRIHGDV